MTNDDRVPLVRPATKVQGILPLVAGRWSPRAFDPRPVEPEKLKRIFEAASWAASSFNEQPWRYFVALASDPHRPKIESLLVESNAWAKRAPVLIVAAASTTFARNGRPNAVAIHDLGLADASMSLQALQEGVAVHGMAGFDAARAKTELLMPADWQPVAMWAMGYPGGLSSLPEPLRTRELEPRTRRPLSQTVFAGEANRAHPATAG
jgi:nitroreductase